MVSLGLMKLESIEREEKNGANKKGPRPGTIRNRLCAAYGQSIHINVTHARGEAGLSSAHYSLLEWVVATVCVQQSDIS